MSARASGGRVSLITVPYMTGDDRQGGSKGPERLLEAGADEVVGARGLSVTVEHVERRGSFRDSASASRAVNKELAPVVRRAIACGQLPLVLAGSCDACIGVLGGFDHARCGVVWLDAHADFNTPDSTISGFFAGMSLAVITGHCYRSLWGQIGDNTPVPETATLLLGLRDVNPPAERERLERSPLTAVSWHDGAPECDVVVALEDLATRVREIYLHVDLDVLDPEIAPGVVDSPVPGGLSLQDVEQIIGASSGRFRIRAAAVTTYNPELDRDEKTLRAALRIIDLIALAA
jgi:arginase